MRYDYKKIARARNNVDNIEHNYLKERGWAYTSCSPDFVWRWQKEINGVVYALNRHAAISVQNGLDQIRSLTTDEQKRPCLFQRSGDERRNFPCLSV